MAPLVRLVKSSPSGHQTVLMYLVASLLNPQTVSAFVKCGGLTSVLHTMRDDEQAAGRRDGALVIGKVAQLADIPLESKCLMQLEAC